MKNRRSKPNRERGTYGRALTNDDGEGVDEEEEDDDNNRNKMKDSAHIVVL